MNVTITTNRGKAFKVSSICVPMLDESKCIIELEDERTPAEIFADFDGLETITKTDDVTDQVKHYDGFASLVEFKRVKGNTVRLTLEKGAETNG